MTAMAYYGTRRGGSGCRVIRTAQEAEKILTGGYGATEVRIERDGEIVGERYRQDRAPRGWFWWFDRDAFPMAQIEEI